MALPNDEFYTNLGLAIRGYRKQRELTQEALGKRLDPPMTRASIANIEAGKQRILAHTLVDLATILTVKVEELVAKVERPDIGDTELEHEILEKVGSAIGSEAAKSLARKVIAATRRRAS